MPIEKATGSARRHDLLERAYAYALEHGLADLSLRPLAAAVGSSPRVLLYLFGSKDGLIQALLARAREDEVRSMVSLRDSRAGMPALADTVGTVWAWLSAGEHRPLLALWLEAYSRSIIDPDGPWGGFARATVDDWLDLLSESQQDAGRENERGEARRTLVLAALRGVLMDLLATGDLDRANAAIDVLREELAP